VAYCECCLRGREVAAPLKLRVAVATVVDVTCLRGREVAAPLKRLDDPLHEFVEDLVSAAERSRPH